jgi:phosphoribosylaminoimidazole-succinocarboxamide synthase
VGEHDEAIDFPAVVAAVGASRAAELRDLTLALYSRAAEIAAGAGLILADTKFEFGWIDGQVALIDEVLTPDSSRFWDGELYAPGASPPSFDKQYVRDFVAGSGWNKEPPAPALPDEVIAGTRDRYVTAYERLTGESWRNEASV